MAGGSDCGGSEIERSYYTRTGSFYAASTYSRRTNEDVGVEGASSVSGTFLVLIDPAFVLLNCVGNTLFRLAWYAS
jgi:hypothetical protein